MSTTGHYGKALREASLPECRALREVVGPVGAQPLPVVLTGTKHSGDESEVTRSGPMEAERFTLTLQALPNPDGVSAIIRLRRVLKAALRSYGLRCVRCELEGEATALGSELSRHSRGNCQNAPASAVNQDVNGRVFE